MQQYAPNYPQAAIEQTFSSVMQRVYLWMTLGLLTTAGVAFAIANSGVINILAANPMISWVLLFIQLGLVFGLAAGINRLSATTATLLFFVYAAVNGITFSFIFLAYAMGDISLAFVTTSALFGVMSVVGYTTKTDLSKFGGILFMGLIGLVIASVVSMFWANSVLMWIINYAGVAIFTGMTAYDTQRIKRMSAQVVGSNDRNAIGRVAVLGALSLYLDFINLFLFLLRIFGRRR
jgi:FtsH-binding integral membrane protein